MSTCTTSFEYDETSDSLYVLFGPNEPATVLALTDHVLLRVNKARRQAIGITILDFSLLSERAEAEPGIPVTGLADLSDELRELALEILRSPPVREVLPLAEVGRASPPAVRLPATDPSLRARYPRRR